MVSADSVDPLMSHILNYEFHYIKCYNSIYSLQPQIPFETVGAIRATQNSGYMQESTRNVSQ